MLLTELARVKEYLKIKADDVSNDPLIERLIEEYSAAIQQYLDRHIEKRERTEDFDARPGQTRFFLSGYPIASVAEFKNDYDRVFGSGTVIPATDYAVYGSEGMIRLTNAVLTPGALAVRVKYTGGLAESTKDLEVQAPSIVLACEKQVAYAYRSKGLDGAGSASSQGGSVSKESDLGDEDGPFIREVNRLLAPYRNHGGAL